MGNCVSACAKDQNPVHAITAESSNGGSSKTTNNSSSRASTFTGDSYNPSQDVSGSLGDTNSSTLHSFTFGDVKAATRNFRPESVLGEGGFGSVFKGWIDEQSFKPAKPGLGTVIAVKKLNDDSLQGHKEWLAEVRILSQLHHPNLVKLIGYCAEDDHRLLIYEFMPRGSLENHLFRGGIHIHPLSWALRMKIAWGTSKGLAFLHDAGVIYRDLKTSNILLDPEFNAKLSDFGLAKDAPIGDNTHVSTCVMGTHGYAAPEYIATGHLTVKSDVYSFGVFLLEILTGRRAVDSTRPIGEQNVVEWVRYLMDTRKIYRVIDPRLDGQYSMKGAQSALSLALNCLNSESKLRPQIKDVVDVLESLVNGRETTKSRSKPSCSDLARGADRSTQKGHFVPSNGASHQ